MSFESPERWLLSLLALPILGLYLWGLGRSSREVATGVIWRPTLERQAAWVRYRRWVSCAVHCLLVVLLAGTLAQPVWVSRALSPCVVILDTSASMKATDVAPRRFDLAREAAESLIRRKSSLQPFALLTADSLVRVRSPFTREREGLLNALDQIQPSDGVSRMAEALRLAFSLRHHGKEPHVIVLSDGCFSVEEKQIFQRANVDLIAYGGASRNVAITQLRVRPAIEDVSAYDVLMEFACYSPTSETVERSVRFAGQESRERLVLEAGERRRQIERIRPNKVGLLQVEARINDDLPSDNVVRTVLAPRSPLPVLLVTKGNEPLRAALASNPGIQLTVAAALPSQPLSDRVVILDGQTPARLPAGRFLVLQAAADCDLWKTGGSMPAADCVVTSQQLDHPVLRDLRFQDLVIQQATRLEFVAPFQTLVSGGSEASLVAEFRDQQRFLLVSAVIQRDSDWPWRRDWPLFLNRAIAYLGGELQPPFEVFSTDDILLVEGRPALLGSASSIVDYVGARDGLRAELLTEAGLWRLSKAHRQDGNGSSSPSISLNLINAAESDLKSQSADWNSTSIEEIDLGAGWPLWPLGALLCLMGMMGEWFLYRNRRTI